MDRSRTSRPRSVGFVLLLMALGAVAGLVIGFVQGYLDLPNSPLPPGAQSTIGTTGWT